MQIIRLYIISTPLRAFQKAYVDYVYFKTTKEEFT